MKYMYEKYEITSLKGLQGWGGESADLSHFRNVGLCKTKVKRNYTLVDPTGMDQQF